MGGKGEETKFLKTSDASQEVSGWKMFIFLPQNTLWKFVLIFTILGKVTFILIRALYDRTPDHYSLIDGIFNAIYTIDVLLAALHAFLANVRKLKHGEKRNPGYLLLDVISLLPLQFIYENTVYSNTPKKTHIGNYMSLIGVLRLYQVPRNFYSIKSSMLELRNFLIITVIQLLTYTILLVEILGGIYFQIMTPSEKQKCMENFFTCVVGNAIKMYRLAFQSGMKSDNKEGKVSFYYLIMFFLLIGYMYTYGCLIPMFVIVVLKYLMRFSDFYLKLKRKQIQVYNGIKEKILRGEILEYFHHLMLFEQGEPDLMKILPLCLKKNIFADIHWEAIKHSYLLQDLSIGCKRSLALGMQKEFLLPSTKLFEKDTNSTYFVYLESGVLQVMAEENNRAPVLSLAAGTVIGEMSFFLNKKSTAFVRASKYTIVHLLPLRHFFRVLADYPDDRKQIFQKMNARIMLAKSTYYVKNHVCTYFSFEQERYKLIEQTQWGNIKWIKGQYQAILDLQKQLMQTTDELERRFLELNTQIKHTSVNLALLSVNNDKGFPEGMICLKSFPWMINPHSQFLSVWKKIILCFVSVSMIVYPYVISWYSRVPHWFFVASCVVSFVYTIDIMVHFITAIRVNNVIVKKFSTVLVNRLNSVDFYLDVLSALPFQVFVYYTRTSPYASNLFFVNALMKLYVIVPVINRWNYAAKFGVSVRTYVKYFFFLMLFIFNIASFYKLTFLNCVFGYCPQSYCRELLIKTNSVRQASLCCAMKAMSITLQYVFIPIDTDFRLSLIVGVFALTAQGFSLAMTGECIASYVLDLISDLEFKLLMDFIYSYMGKNKLTGFVRDRVMALMEFQWMYDKNNYIPGKPTNWNYLPYHLQEEVYNMYFLPILKNCKLFESESQAFLFDLCQRASIMVLPANSLLLTLGNQSRCLYVVKKGFVQVNSFVAGDLHLNVAKPICAGESDAFPVLDVLSQTPSAVSAIASTDCELLCLDLEDLISAMMIHGNFKDFVDAITTTDLSLLSTAKLGVTEFKDVFRDSEVHRRKVFRKIKCVGVILRYLLKKRAIDSESRTYWFWEVFRVLFIVVGLIVWPLAIGCIRSVVAREKIYIALLTIEVILFCIDFYIRANVAFYNKKGIYVTHTLLTAQHYLTTAFITDLIAFCPNLHILHLIITHDSSKSWSLLLVHILFRTLALYRFIGVMEYHNERSQTHRLITVTVFLCLVMHFFLSFQVNLAFSGPVVIKPTIVIVNNKKFVTDIKHPYQLYFYWMATIVMLLLKITIYDFERNEHNIVLIMTIIVLGLFSKIWLYARLTILSMMSNKNLNTYQHYMRSFVNFLTKQKAEDNIFKTAIEHFEYEWKKQNGFDVHKILSELPQTLHEDILYPIYHETLSAVRCLSNANEYFYRSLCINIEELNLREGSLVIFQKEVQSNIFFVYRGQCCVENTPQVLFKGAMIGDIKRKGIMDHNVRARTNMKLLKIPSSTFFLILENFERTKQEYSFEIQSATDYLSSIFYEPVKVTHYTVTPEAKTTESEFVRSRDEAAPGMMKPKRKWRLKDNSKTVRAMSIIGMVAAFSSVMIAPVFMSVRVFTAPFLYIIYLLDIIWLTKLIFFMFVKDSTEVKKINRKSLRRLQKFLTIIYQGLSVFPLEIVPYAACQFQLTDYCCYVMCLCYVNRMLRFFYVIEYFRKKQKRLIMNVTSNVLGILMSKVAIVNCVVFINLAIHSEGIFDKKCYKTLNGKQTYELLINCYCMVNCMVNAGLSECAATTVLEFLFVLFVTMYAMFVEAFFINQVLLMFLLSFHNKFTQMVEIQQIDRYLSKRDVSPILRSRTKEYFRNLLNAFYEGANPAFVRSAPSFIKTDIMENLYISHLNKCFAFRDLDINFLRQLTTRMFLNIFFPGDYITEKGDVDHNMYFIQAGEVYLIETDSHYTALERITGVYVDGDVFGVLQGILQAHQHTHTRRAKTLTRILVLNYHKWDDLRTAFPDTMATIHSRCVRGLA